MKSFLSLKTFPLLLFILTAIFSCQQERKYPGPLSPEESMKTFHFADDFDVELYAAEPLVQDPVSMVFDDNGDAYVVEMADANMPDSIKGRGKIVLLKDLDHDGTADTSILFAEGLTEATTALPWKDGLIVTAAPHILYMKDTNGDGKADQTDTLFSGFFTGNDEAQITSLRFGVDNWIYADNTGNAGQVKSHLDPAAKKISMQGADFRFRMDRNAFEQTTGPGQYGLALDDWGHRFFTQNTLHIRQAVMPWRYMHRHAYLPSSTAVVNISDHELAMFQLTPTPWWRQQRTDRRNKTSVEAGREPTEQARDHFTGASGGTFYGGDAYPEEYYGSIFTGEVAGNLIHRDVLVAPDDPNDPFYTATRGGKEQDKEFLASTDSWFRPTNFAVGPDGCLYMVDMYRQHIETPVSIPDDLQEDMDFAAGSDKGRIYRIVPKNKSTFSYGSIDLKKNSSEDLVKALSSSNQWLRLHAHRNLIERQDKEIIPEVSALFHSTEDPRVRIQALYVLEGLNALTVDIVRKSLKDSSAGIRENALILSERFPELRPEVTPLVEDKEARVALQATFSLGELDDNQAIPSFIKVLNLRGENSWFRNAVLSSKSGSSIKLFEALLNNPSFVSDEANWKKIFLKDLSRSIGARGDKAEMVTLVKLLKKSPLSDRKKKQAATLDGLLIGLEVSDADKKEQWTAIKKEKEEDIEKAIAHLQELL